MVNPPLCSLRSPMSFELLTNLFEKVVDKTEGCEALHPSGFADNLWPESAIITGGG